MQQVSRFKWLCGTVALGAALGAGALFAQDKAAPAGGGVTFQNDSSHAIQVFARYGSDGGTCSGQPNQVELNIAAGTSSTVDSGSSKVCFCLDLPDRNSCPTGWVQVKAGGKRVFH